MRDKIRLLQIGLGLEKRGRRSGRVFRPKLFIGAPEIIGNNCVGGVQNPPGASVVLLQLYKPRFGEIARKIQYIIDGRAAPAVNALVVVAHHANIFIFAA